MIATHKRRAAALPPALAAALALGAVLAPPAHAFAEVRTAAAPVDDQAALRLARTFLDAGDARSALPILERMAARKGADPAVQVEFGGALLDAGLVDRAIGVFQAVDPKSAAGADAELGLARAQLMLDQPARAMTHADKALALSPKNEAVLVGRGVILDRLGRHVEAQASYREALAEAPRSVPARTDLALSLAVTGHYDQSLDILEPIGRSADATPRDRQNLAFVYGLKGDKEAAAALGRIDLSEAAVQGNAKFYDAARSLTR